MNITGGVVFSCGGGNFGDLYDPDQTFRLNLVRNLPNVDIVFLPQSISYTKPANVEKHNNVFKNHKHLTMMLCDYDSLQFARVNFPNVTSVYVPDLALLLGPMLPNSEPVVDILFLIRNDIEGVLSMSAAGCPSVTGVTNLFLTDRTRAMEIARQHQLSAELWDFPIDGFPNRTAKDTGELMWDYRQIYPGRLLTTNMPSSEAMTSYRVLLGNSLMSRGRVVVTDRLHASIMSTLIDRPVVYLDNSYKKLTKVRASLKQTIAECTDAVLNAQFANTIQEAVRLASEVLT